MLVSAIFPVYLPRMRQVNQNLSLSRGQACFGAATWQHLQNECLQLPGGWKPEVTPVETEIADRLWKSDVPPRPRIVFTAYCQLQQQLHARDITYKAVAERVSHLYPGEPLLDTWQISTALRLVRDVLKIQTPIHLKKTRTEKAWDKYHNPDAELPPNWKLRADKAMHQRAEALFRTACCGLEQIVFTAHCRLQGTESGKSIAMKALLGWIHQHYPDAPALNPIQARQSLAKVRKILNIQTERGLKKASTATIWEKYQDSQAIIPANWNPQEGWSPEADPARHRQAEEIFQKSSGLVQAVFTAHCVLRRMTPGKPITHGAIADVLKIWYRNEPLLTRIQVNTALVTARRALNIQTQHGIKRAIARKKGKKFDKDA